MRCDDVGAQLASVVDGGTTLDRRAAKHAAGCLRCQAELAHYRRLRRTLRQLAFEAVPVPAGLSEAVIAHLDDLAGLGSASPAHAAWTRRAAYAGALAATAAGAAGALALVASRRRGREALAGLAGFGPLGA